MKKLIKLTNKILAIFILTKLLAPNYAYAYIDPGSGSYFVQVVVGFLLGVSFFWRSILDKIKSLFLKKKDLNRSYKVANDKNKKNKES